jgi:hypothetical protein
MKKIALRVGVAFATFALSATSASALSAHGQLLRLAPHGRLNTNQSQNWFGYNQGTLEQGGKLFNSITGNWTVPRATQHTRGQDEYSSDWIGIGGGCLDAGCAVGDNTLIQTGTEQDISGGHPSYSAWWEIIPAPSLTITNFKVAAGDRMHAAITEVVPNSELWKITLQDLTRHETYTTTVPYSSSHATAEWIEETPLIIGTNAGFAALPNLSTPAFDLATTNGHPAKLKRAEQIALANANGKTYSVPSAPDPDADGFNACAWATSCGAPGGS